MATSALDATRNVIAQDNPVSAIASGVNAINAISSANNAQSAANAAELRNWQVEQNRKAFEFNAAEAQKNRDWQKMMSDTAHQREVADLKAAGLNPVLSANGGNGASVGSGATASATGVNSSGARGEVDTSLNAALVSLLGGLLQHQTQLETARVSAEGALAVAERNASASRLVAQIYKDSAKDVAGMNMNSAVYTANKHYDASKYSADRSASQSHINKLVDQMISGKTNLTNTEIARIQTDMQKYGYDSQFSSNLIKSILNMF